MAMDSGVTSTRVHSTRNPTTSTSTTTTTTELIAILPRENMIEGMIDQVLEGQQKLMVNVNGKIDAVYS